MTPDSQHVHVRIVPDDDEDGSGAPSEVPADVTISKIFRAVVRTCWYHMCPPNGMGQKRARKGLAQPPVRHVGDVSASPETGKLAELTRKCQFSLFRACIRT